MKKYLFSIAAVIALGFSACTKEEVKVETPSIVGSWKLSKMKLVGYEDNYIYYDTTFIGPKFFGDEISEKYNADKTFETTETNSTGKKTITNGTYNFIGSTLTRNYSDLSTEQAENVTVDARQLVMTFFEPSKTDPSRTVITLAYERQ